VTLAFNPSARTYRKYLLERCGLHLYIRHDHTNHHWNDAVTDRLNALKNLGTADYSLTLPGAQAQAILTDNRTKIIQDPEVRVSDGEKRR